MNRTLFPHFFAFLLTGGLLAFPGSCLDLLLRDFGWSPALFGFAMMLQGCASFVGSRFASKRCGGEHYRRWTFRSLWFLAVGIVLYYFCDWTTLPLARGLGMPEFTATLLRLLGICCIGFGIGTNGIFNNAAALSGPSPSFALNLLNMGFTTGAVLLPLTTSQYLRFADVDSRLLWRTPVVFLSLFYILLSLYVLHSRHLSQPPPVKSMKESSSSKIPPLPVIAASLVLFCYVGSEINLSNNLGLLSERLFSFSADTSRVASSFFWGGLLAARIFFTFHSRSPHRYPYIMAILASLCLILFLMLFGGVVPNNEFAVMVSRLLILGLGLCIGGMYSLALGSLTLFFDSVQDSRHFANFTVLCGVAGAVLLPFAYGQLSAVFGLLPATWFIVVLLTGMLMGTLILALARRRLIEPAVRANI
jgi:fucose permease